MTPRLPSGIEVLPGVDEASLWERFQPFEALHHHMDIMNPMSSGELDAVIDALAPRDGMTALDIACGHGELLLRLATRWDVAGTGIDLSPWQIARCARRSADTPMRGSVRWILGDGSAAPGTGYDLATCLGASWVFHGFHGTAKALARRVRPGGRVAVGDLRLADGAEPAHLPGKVLTGGEQEATLRRLGLEPITEVLPSVDSWRGYCEGTVVGAERFAAGHEGDPVFDRRDLAREWLAEFERDRLLLTWSVWVAERRPPSGT